MKISWVVILANTVVTVCRSTLEPLMVRTLKSEIVLVDDLFVRNFIAATVIFVADGVSIIVGFIIIAIFVISK